MRLCFCLAFDIGGLIQVFEALYIRPFGILAVSIEKYRFQCDRHTIVHFKVG